MLTVFARAVEGVLAVHAPSRPDHFAATKGPGGVVGHVDLDAAGPSRAALVLGDEDRVAELLEGLGFDAEVIRRVLRGAVEE